MLRSAVPARPHPRRARTAAAIGALALLSLAAPGVAAHADVSPAQSIYSGTATVATMPGSNMLALMRLENGAWTWSNDGGRRAEIGAAGPFSFTDLSAGTYRLARLTLGDLYQPLTAELSDGSTVPVDELAVDLAAAHVSVPSADPSRGTTLDGTSTATDQSISIPAPLVRSTLSGVVTDSNGTTGQRGATVALYAYDPVSGVTEAALDAEEHPATAVTTSGGRYTFTGLPAGYYLAQATYGSDNAGFDPEGGSAGVSAGGVWLDGDTPGSAATLVLAATDAPYVPPVVVDPSPSASPTAVPTPSQVPTTSPSTPAKPLPSPEPTLDPIKIAVPEPGIIRANIPAIAQFAIVSAPSGDGATTSREQDAVNNILLDELSAAQQQALAAGLAPPTGPTVRSNVVPPPFASPPGLYVHVIDGLINVTNKGAATSFQAGQFGYTPSFTAPPIVIPSNPGVVFAPPPVFTQSVTTTYSKASPPKSAVDCEVRRVDTAGDKAAPVKKLYCNRVAAPRASTHAKHHQPWRRHVTVQAPRGAHHVRMPVQHLPGSGWYRIVTTHDLILRFTAISDHGHRPKHPIHLTRSAAVRSVTYVHLARH